MAPSPSDHPPPADDATQTYSPQDALASRVVEVLDQYLESLKAGEQPDRAKLLAENPEIANQLEACLAGVEFIHAGSAAGKPEGKRLGDFRIIKEVGSGGMGAVYEAEQVSLGRHVALKILRFGPVSDAAAIQRFQREAETVARLHHTNIVPIFAVGSEGGVNYYAMQFIFGSSLDRVLREKGAPIPAQTVAEWGLQAAEALAHAHARGVIHRDVKPSNLLIDEEGRIWLTDFGLAKRLDDVTLSMTGALIGTPRYMSPEQALAKHQGLDHRTDLYSLGATLYELATNKPVFTGDSAHDVLAKIIVRDPDPPRSHNPSLHRDLETILLKCLAKEPEKRYDSARHLADDLRAFTEGRAISARRASLAETAVRWFRQQKKSVALTLIAVATTLSLVLLAMGGGYAWHRARLSTLMLKTDHPPLLAKLLDADGAPVQPAVSVPTLEPLEAPTGEYSLRISAEQRLSETFDVSLARGDSRTRKLDLEDQLLWRDVKLDRSYRTVRYRTVPGKGGVAATEPAADRNEIVRPTETGLICGTPTERWSLQLKTPTHALLKDGANLVWPWDALGGSNLNGVGRFDSRPFLVSNEAQAAGALDMNTDGVDDFVLAFRHQAVVIALSGLRGEPIWIAAYGTANKEEGEKETYQPNVGAVLQPPLVVADQDNDGIADLVLSSAYVLSRPQETITRRLELISGATGKPIWRRDWPAELFALPNGETVPYEFQWFYGSSGGYSSSGRGNYSSYHYYTRERGSMRRSGPSAYRPSETVLAPDGKNQLLLTAGTGFLTVELKTGELKSQEMSIRPGIEPRFADFDADGATDALLADSPSQSPNKTRVQVWSSAKERVLWTYEAEAELADQTDDRTPPPSWPIVADVDGDGAADVLLPDGSTLHQTPGRPWGKVALVNGRTGKRVWSVRILNADQQLEHFRVGPDVDGDGCRDVFVASLWSRDMELFVDCLSGRDGTTLWRTVQPLFNPKAESAEYYLFDMEWLASREETFPRLSVSIHADNGDATDRVCLFDIRDGRLFRIANGVSTLDRLNLDSDGIDDWLLFTRSRNRWDFHGELQAQRGVGREQWRRVDATQTPVGDLNGDGVFDLVTTEPQTKIRTRCGRTGRSLWQTELHRNYSSWQAKAIPAAERDRMHSAPTKIHDLNGDGVADLLYHYGSDWGQKNSPWLMAVSGKSGHVLWESEPAVKRFKGFPWLDCRDLDGDGAAEVIVAAASEWIEPGLIAKSNEWQLTLAVLDGGTGKLKWWLPLVAPAPSGTPLKTFDFERLHLEPAYGDLNGDRVLDLVVIGRPDSALVDLSMLAVSGRDGSKLWAAPLPADPNPQQVISNTPPAAICDVDGDGRLEAIILTMQEATSGNHGSNLRLQILDGAVGTEMAEWTTEVHRWVHSLNSETRLLPGRLRPMPVRMGGGKHWIGVVANFSSWNVFLVDEAGQTAATAPLASVSTSGSIARMTVLDADGDGADELLLYDETGFGLYRPNRLSEPLWRRQLSGRLENVLPPESPGRIVISPATAGMSFCGLDALTGKTVWTSVGLGVETAKFNQGSALLSPPRTDAAPNIFYQSADIAFVRRASPTEDDEAIWIEKAAPTPARLVAADPRLVRPLPWVSYDRDELARLGREFQFVAYAAFYGVTLVGLPGFYFARLLRRRTWTLRSFLMLPAVAAVFFMGVLIDGVDNDFHTFGGKLFIAVCLAGPFMVSCHAFQDWFQRGFWKTLVGWLIVWAVITLVIVGIAVTSLFLRSDLLEGERCAWDGWYWVLLPGLYFTALLLTFFQVVSAAVAAVVRRFHPSQPANA